MKNNKLGRPGSRWTDAVFPQYAKKRKGWTNHMFQHMPTELDSREQAIYEHYCAWCRSLDCEPGPANEWRLETRKLSSL